MKVVTLPKILMPYHCDGLIRLGKSNDGGYIINSIDVVNSVNLLSLGIGNDISFERDFVAYNPNAIVTAYDGSVDSQHDNFFSEKHKLYRSNITIDNIQNILKQCSNKTFLKCDIDGTEYDILYDILSYSNKFSGIAIEFHNVSSYENFNELTNFISKISLRLTHTHINNYTYVITPNNSYIPDVLELTFSSNINNTSLHKNIDMPNILDMPNNPYDDEFKIYF